MTYVVPCTVFDHRGHNGGALVNGVWYRVDDDGVKRLLSDPFVSQEPKPDVLCAADDRNQWSAARCDKCDGRGFTRSGDFYGRSFPVCKACAGVGQTYLAPVGGK